MGRTRGEGERWQGLPDRPLLATEIRFIVELLYVYFFSGLWCVCGISIAVLRIIFRTLFYSFFIVAHIVSLELCYSFTVSLAHFVLHISFTISITLGYSSLSCMLILFHLLLF